MHAPDEQTELQPLLVERFKPAVPSIQKSAITVIANRCTLLPSFYKLEYSIVRTARIRARKKVEK